MGASCPVWASASTIVKKTTRYTKDSIRILFASLAASLRINLIDGALARCWWCVPASGSLNDTLHQPAGQLPGALDVGSCAGFWSPG
jgi:hypothetical protein